jgi:hypothetical protein
MYFIQVHVSFASLTMTARLLFRVTAPRNQEALLKPRNQRLTFPLPRHPPISRTQDPCASWDL